MHCPYCKVGIGITMDPSTQLPRVTVTRSSGLKIPRRLLVPGFAMLMLGLAGAFVNLYVAIRCENEPGYDRKYARDRVSDFQNGSELTFFGKKKASSSAFDDFGAIAGNAAALVKSQEDDDIVANAWTPYVQNVSFAFAGVSLLGAAGGLAVLRGKLYWLAILGCVASILNIHNGCCFLGSVAGIWGLVMLFRDDNRRHFGFRT